METRYLDVCTLCRPFDDQQQLRIRLETDAVYLIFRQVERGLFRAVVSPVHLTEVAAIGEFEERLEIQALLARLAPSPSAFDLLRARARTEVLHSRGIGLADSAHVAFAEQAADYFITCDDKLLKRCRRLDLDVVAMGPVEFAMREDKP